MNGNNRVRLVHRWVSIAFTVTVIANFAKLAAGRTQVTWMTYAPLLPLALLTITGLYLFLLPHAAMWRSRRRAGRTGRE
ncbi:MAG: hypothetical protein AB7I33_08245 [Gemmatimonadales bacterium]